MMEIATQLQIMTLKRGGTTVLTGRVASIPVIIAGK